MRPGHARHSRTSSSRLVPRLTVRGRHTRLACPEAGRCRRGLSGIRRGQARLTASSRAQGPAGAGRVRAASRGRSRKSRQPRLANGELHTFVPSRSCPRYRRLPEGRLGRRPSRHGAPQGRGRVLLAHRRCRLFILLGRGLLLRLRHACCPSLLLASPRTVPIEAQGDPEGQDERNAAKLHSSEPGRRHRHRTHGPDAARHAKR